MSRDPAVPRQAVTTSSAPQAIGPYSQAIKAGGFVFVSGQIPLDPATGALVPGGVEEQTHRVLQNIREILHAAGGSMDRVVRTTVFLVDLAEFGAVNTIYAEYFPAPAPARATVQVGRLHRDVRVEIDAVAVL
jgi:2-iminobutanoate/2-iminopropanoate deaminase